VKPAETTKAVKPKKPAKAVKAKKPAKLASPMKTAETTKAVKPKKSTKAVKPKKLARLVTTVKSVKAAKPKNPAKAVKPPKPVKLATTVKPAETVKAEKPTKVVKPTKSVKPLRPAEPGLPSKLGQPVRSARPDKSNKPVKSVKGSKTTKPPQKLNRAKRFAWPKPWESIPKIPYSQEDPLSPAVIVLAAGKGTRMRSDEPKVLRPLMGKSIITHVLNAAKYLAPERLIVVTGYEAEKVERHIAHLGPIFVRQLEPKGTGQATQLAMKALEDFEGPVVILPGDVPLLSPQTLIDLMDAHMALGAPLSVLTVRVGNPAAYGRIIRDKNGWLEKIVEARDATHAELSIQEVNTGVYVVDCATLRENIFNLKPNNDQKEYYLTDIVAEFSAKGYPAAAVIGPEPLEIQGINDCRDLATAQSTLRDWINESWLLAGVTMEDPATTYIESTVKLSRNVILGQGVILAGDTKIGSDVVIGPYCCFKNVEVDPGITFQPHMVFSDVRVTDDLRFLSLREENYYEEISQEQAWTTISSKKDQESPPESPKLTLSEESTANESASIAPTAKKHDTEILVENKPDAKEPVENQPEAKAAAKPMEHKTTKPPSKPIRKKPLKPAYRKATKVPKQKKK
jgi:UDP-N-acetylglucosamine diphosphorylase/glucosamine-1-phosphate N-acetyltransferase